MTTSQPEQPTGMQLESVQGTPQHAGLQDWNVLATVRQGGYRRARRLLSRFGHVSGSGFPNVLLMQVMDGRLLLEELCREAERQPTALECLGRVIPTNIAFTFSSPEEFDTLALEAARAYLPELAGKSFHVRVYRHGFKGRLSTHESERKLGQGLQQALAQAGTPGQVRFDEPDVILAVVTVGNRAGLSLWTKEEMRRFPCLRLD
ncbi:MAG: hypothetical protein K6T86_19435 [Pirellulales bacterium]|nr:hypothetical protein [Pirellulales bacterium]